MRLAIRRASLTSDREMLVEMVRRNLNPLADEERFDWLYGRNPAGEARVWLATEGISRAVMGMVAAFPRRLWVGPDERSGWVMGEFCVSSKFRSLGPAVALQRACLAGIDDGESPLWYDFPSDGMMAVYRRLGVGLPRRMVRLARPLRVNVKVEGMVGSSAVARGVSSVGNALLRLRDRGLRADRAISVAVQKEPFGEEFTVLSREVRGRHGVCVSRSKAYLNWRFLDGWSASHEVFAGRREGELVGYAVVAPEGSGARVVDLFAGDGEGVIADLIAGVTTELRTRGVETVSIWLSESHPWMGEVRGAGFVRRESSPVLVSPLARMSSHDGGPAWALTQGDRDS